MKQGNVRQTQQNRLDLPSETSNQLLDQYGINEASFSYYRRLKRVRRFVEENLPEPISLADAAQVAGMERTAFSNFFRCKTGICFRDWLATVRVDRAMELMSEDNMLIKEIAGKVGYRNVRSFQRVFLRLAGCSPIEYKHSIRQS